MAHMGDVGTGTRHRGRLRHKCPHVSHEARAQVSAILPPPSLWNSINLHNLCDLWMEKWSVANGGTAATSARLREGLENPVEMAAMIV